MSLVQEISALELKNLIDSNKKVAILDVREQEELLISSLPSVTHIPLMQVEHSIELWRTACEGADYRVVICRSGVRSLKAAELLTEELSLVHFNLSGGINAYAKQVDPSLQTY